MIPTNDRHLAHQHADRQWRRTMKQFFMFELPMALSPAVLLMAASLGHWSWWLLLPTSAKAGVTLSVSVMAVAVWVMRLPPERPAIYSPEVDKALTELWQIDHSYSFESVPSARQMLEY